MKFWKLVSASLALALALALATSANGAIISYGGYTHDTDTNIVTGNGLEWLQWDVTVGESINSIQSQLDTLEGGGWSIASNAQMADLFNAFEFGVTFDVDENTTQQVWPGSLFEADGLFISMFGDTYVAGGVSICDGSGCLAVTEAFFGLDADADGYVNYGGMADSYAGDDGGVALFDDWITKDRTHDYTGIALVREVSAVPVPAAVWLFGSGLIGLAGMARRKKV